MGAGSENSERPSVTQWSAGPSKQRAADSLTREGWSKLGAKGRAHVIINIVKTPFQKRTNSKVFLFYAIRQFLKWP